MVAAFSARFGQGRFGQGRFAGDPSGGFVNAPPVPDVTAPSVIGSAPADNATGVAVGSTIVLTFSEPVVAGASGKVFRLRDVDTDSTVEDFTLSTGAGSAGGTVVLDGSGTFVTLMPGAEMSASTHYAIWWMPDIVRDAAGNAIANQSDDTVLNFTTAAAAPTAPAQFGAGDWSITDDATSGDATLTITALPDNGGSAITGLFAKIDGGAAVNLGGTATGVYALDDLFTDGVQASVTIYAANAIGNGSDSAARTVTTTAPSGSAPTISSLVIDEANDLITFTSDMPGTAHWLLDDTATHANAAAVDAASPRLAEGTFPVLAGSNDTTIDLGDNAGAHYFHAYVDYNGNDSNVLSGAVDIAGASVPLVIQSAGWDGADVYASSHATTLPSGIANGNRLIMLIALGAESRNISSAPAGWTQIADFVGGGGSKSRIFAYEKTADGTEGGTSFPITLSGGKSLMCGLFLEMQLIAGSRELTTNTADNDPPSITPTWGSGDTLYMAVACRERVSGAPGAPTGYADLVYAQSNTSDSTSNGACMLAAAFKTIPVATEDPGTFASFTANPTGAMTIALR